MDIKTYFETTGTTITFLATKTKLSRTTIHNILHNGAIPNIETALAIEKATDGKVTLYDWVKLLDDSVDD